MRGLSRTLGVAILGALLSSCMGGGLPSQSGSALHVAARSPGGNPPVAAPGMRPDWSMTQGILVTDQMAGDVRALKHCGNGLICAPTFTFNNGINQPLGAWSDHHYLYVTNGNATVTEYKPNPVQTFTYSTGLNFPQDVVTDRQRHVYVADYGCCNTGSIKEYKHNNNNIFAQCPTPFYLGPYGIAIDRSGDVFVSWSDYVSGHVSEYVGGLSGCNPVTLLTFSFYVYGIAFDSAGNLLISDYSANAVDISPPPYSAASTLISGIAARNVRINRANDQLLITDGSKVYVYSYPGAASLQTLGSVNGLSSAMTAVDWKNYSQ